MRCKLCNIKKVFKNKRGLEQHNRMAHSLQDYAGTPASTTTNSPEIQQPVKEHSPFTNANLSTSKSI